MDIINVEILADGTLKIETDKVSGANHTNAEGLLRQLAQDSGGAVDRKRKAGFHSHVEHGKVVSHSH